MALNSSGPISLAGGVTGQSIALELSKSGTAQISLNDSDVRNLVSIVSGQISLSNFYGVSSLVLKGFYGLNADNYNVEVLDWSTEATALTGTGYTVNREIGTGAGSANNKGYWLGGGTTAAPINTIDGINFTNFALISTGVGLSYNRVYGASCRSNTTAYYHGGTVASGTYTTDASTYNMVNNTASTIGTAFNNAAFTDAGCNQVDNTTHGWFFNGLNSVSYPGGYAKRITFSTNTVADDGVRFGVFTNGSNNIATSYGGSAVRNSSDVWFRTLLSTVSSRSTGNGRDIAGLGNYEYWRKLLRRFNMATQSVSDVGVQSRGILNYTGNSTSGPSAGYSRGLVHTNMAYAAYSAPSVSDGPNVGLKLVYATQTETLLNIFQVASSRTTGTGVNSKYN